MSPEDGVLYTPEQVAANGWLGPDTTPRAIRKAAAKGLIRHTRYPSWSQNGRIYLTAADIRAIQASGLRLAGEVQPALHRPVARKTSTVTDLHPTGPGLKADPSRARRRKAS